MKNNELRKGLEVILSEYNQARATGGFGKHHPIWSEFSKIQDLFNVAIKEHPNLSVNWSAGMGNWAKVPWISFLDKRETSSTQRGVYCVYLFRQDMSGVYLTLNQGVTEPKNQHGTPAARKLLREKADTIRKLCGSLEQQGFMVDNEIDLRADSGLGVDYEHSTIAYKFYEKGTIPDDTVILRDLKAVLSVYDKYIYPDHQDGPPETPSMEKTDTYESQRALPQLINAIANQGFVFEPWQIAVFVAALRTKPFVILAGVSGTGKSKLPALVARSTGGEARLLPVRPDWTDSSDVLGYSDLQGSFRPGPLLELAREAAANVDKYYICIIDEMNLSRVEHYFAEVLSRIEDRYPAPQGGYQSGPLLSQKLREADIAWAEQGLPANLALVGTVNMDESTHGFSRKVLDRAFTIELSDIDLSTWEPIKNQGVELVTWPVQAWYPRAIQLGELDPSIKEIKDIIDKVIKTLTEVNKFLIHSQLQVGYRTRDEIALFMLHAQEISPHFDNRQGDQVDPLDLALQMKILPRIVGGNGAIRRTIYQLLGWAYNGRAFQAEEEVAPLFESWETGGRTDAIPKAQFPRTAARLCLMWDRLQNEGYTSFWL